MFQKTNPISRIKAEEIYSHAGNVLTVPELDSVITFEIKTLIVQLELYDEQIQSIEIKINQMMKLIAFAGLETVL